MKSSTDPVTLRQSIANDKLRFASRVLVSLTNTLKAAEGTVASGDTLDARVLGAHLSIEESKELGALLSTVGLLLEKTWDPIDVEGKRKIASETEKIVAGLRGIVTWRYAVIAALHLHVEAYAGGVLNTEERLRDGSFSDYYVLDDYETDELARRDALHYALVCLEHIGFRVPETTTVQIRALDKHYAKLLPRAVRLFREMHQNPGWVAGATSSKMWWRH